jgi:hypothetical protein
MQGVGVDDLIVGVAHQCLWVVTVESLRRGRGGRSVLRASVFTSFGV